MKLQVEISGMSCGGCVSSVKKALEQLNGVDTVEVTLNPPMAVITSGANYTKEEISKVLANAGNYAIAEKNTDEDQPRSGGSSCG